MGLKFRQSTLSHLWAVSPGKLLCRIRGTASGTGSRPFARWEMAGFYVPEGKRRPIEEFDLYCPNLRRRGTKGDATDQQPTGVFAGR